MVKKLFKTQAHWHAWLEENHEDLEFVSCAEIARAWQTMEMGKP